VHERVHSKESNDISLITGSISFSKDYAGKRINVTVGAISQSLMLHSSKVSLPLQRIFGRWRLASVLGKREFET